MPLGSAGHPSLLGAAGGGGEALLAPGTSLGLVLGAQGAGRALVGPPGVGGKGLPGCGPGCGRGEPGNIRWGAEQYPERVWWRKENAWGLCWALFRIPLPAQPGCTAKEGAGRDARQRPASVGCCGKRVSIPGGGWGGEGGDKRGGPAAGGCGEEAAAALKARYQWVSLQDKERPEPGGGGAVLGPSPGGPGTGTGTGTGFGPQRGHPGPRLRGPDLQGSQHRVLGRCGAARQPLLQSGFLVSSLLLSWTQPGAAALRGLGRSVLVCQLSHGKWQR